MASSSRNLSSTVSRKETYYTILEINHDATSQDIKNAYKRLAILRHPDKNLGNVAKACADFQKLQAAYSTLSDPFSRVKYDNSLVTLETEAPEFPPADFSDDEFPKSETETSAPSTPRPEPEAEYSGSEDDNDDNIRQTHEGDDGLHWRTTAWLKDAIRESVDKVHKYNERMGVLAQEKGDGNYPIEWDELRGELYREMRYQEGLRRDLNQLFATTDR